MICHGERGIQSGASGKVATVVTYRECGPHHGLSTVAFHIYFALI